MHACRLCVGMREVATVPARAAIQRTTLSGVHSERAVMISCITNVYAHPARIHDVPSQVKSTVTRSARGVGAKPGLWTGLMDWTVDGLTRR